MEWEAGSAYLYIFHLDHPALAWEYLRRNPDYRRQWKSGTLNADRASLARWGCSVPENPDYDGRIAEPGWTPEPPDVVCVTSSPTMHGSGRAFSVWNIPGARQLIHTGSHLELHAATSGRHVRLRMDTGLAEGAPCAVIVPMDASIRQRLNAVHRHIDSLTGTRTSHRPSSLLAVTRQTVMHTRMLQAIDGSQAGASQRDIAIALFGTKIVSKKWTPDSELRARVRYLLRRGLENINGGYRTLLMQASHPQGEGA